MKILSHPEDFNNLPIAVFDSGMGGLTVLRTLKKLLPTENFIYLADNNNHPFGEKNSEELEKILQGNFKFFETNPIKMLVIACHTASTISRPELYNQYPFPVFQILPHTIKIIAENKTLKSFAVLATKKTSSSQLYESKILQIRQDLTCQSFPCQDIVSLIERSEQDQNTIHQVIDKILKPIKLQSFDCIVLGSTHFPIYSDYFKSYFNDTILLDPSDSFAKEIHLFLKEYHLLNSSSDVKSDLFLSTKDPKRFAEKAIYYFNDLNEKSWAVKFLDEFI